ncbi:TPA: hypothetical protein HA239_03860 [Candidatus Woesearchaeota archaeon]|nr:hypothetical protein QT06_C0001G0810 [archaeon GW2011_AR15]MBS3103410.1 hypothetical protein [Candidatus Woesearchaeota archaeon]HIH41527.1 hypothetical protein [Candidatus Woesearchaeota archaeon]
MVTKTFDRLRKEIENKDKTREELIVGSRPIIKDSKQAIYAIHRGSVAEAEKLIQKASRGLDELRRLPDQKSSSFDSAVQEYVEAVTYLEYVKTGKLADEKEINADPENYLLGICDLTGELARRAVFSVVKEDFKEVEKIKEFVSRIYEEFLKFELRNSELRKKSDSIKWNLKKIEEILYDLKIRGKL